MDPLKHNLEQTLYDAYFINKLMLLEKKLCKRKKRTFMLLTFCILDTPKGVFWQTSEDPDEMPPNVAFHQGLHWLLWSIQSSGSEVHNHLKISTCDPLKYIMNNPIPL